MSELDGPRDPRSFSVRLIVPLLIVVALGAGVAWWLRPPAEHLPGASAGSRSETGRSGGAVPGRASHAANASAVEIRSPRREACA